MQYKKLKKLAIAFGCAKEIHSDEVGAKKFIAEIYRLNSMMNIPASYPEIKSEDIPTLAKYASKEANPLYPVPVVWGEKDFRRLIKAMRK